MASPAGAAPLPRYLRVQAGVDREMAAILRDAAEDAERMMVRLGEKAGIGAQVRRSQVALALRELRTQQAQMWGSVTKATQKGIAFAAAEATEAQAIINNTMFNALGVKIPELEAGMQVAAAKNLDNYYARAANNIPLSSQVYKTQALSNGWVDRQVNRGILLGRSAKEVAASVRGMIRPDVPGGVSYAAMRLGRTEVNNAYHRATIDQQKDAPWTNGFRWNLSGSHPRADDCDAYANDVHFKGGDPGVFRPNDVPGKPHPACLCFLETVTVDEDEFINRFMNGDYNAHIDQQVYGAGLGVC